MPKHPTTLSLEERALTVDETCAALNTSRATVYAMMAQSEIRYFVLRNRRRIPGSEIVRLLSSTAACA